MLGTEDRNLLEILEWLIKAVEAEEPEKRDEAVGWARSRLRSLKGAAERKQSDRITRSGIK